MTHMRALELERQQGLKEESAHFQRLYQEQQERLKVRHTRVAPIHL